MFDAPFVFMNVVALFLGAEQLNHPRPILVKCNNRTLCQSSSFKQRQGPPRASPANRISSVHLRSDIYWDLDFPMGESSDWAN